jgi:nanoRNase/pAp phosphatase (c-di-AMP/oligoRNAs hydrolase)
MSLTPHQQLQKLFNVSEDILILLPSEPQGDILASAWAVALYLEQHDKKVTVAAEGLARAKERYAFLNEPKNFVESLSGARDFVLSFNTKYNKIIGIRTEEDREEYRIYITPEHGSIDPRDFSFIPAKFKFDLVIVIGAPDKESLGKLYEDNADIFYEAPVVNIDHHPKNENFGQINFVDMTASSCSEIVTHILEKLEQSPVTESVAECLLTGIIASTDSFQKKNTTPKALQTASHLMERGADRQKIMLNLYKTQPLHLLKLWGRVMAQLRWDERLRLVWAPVTVEDLVQARAQASDLPFILEKIRTHYSAGVFFVLLFQETPSAVRGIMKAAAPDALTAAHALWPEGRLRNESLEFTLSGDSIENAEREISDRIRKFVGGSR